MNVRQLHIYTIDVRQLDYHTYIRHITFFHDKQITCILLFVSELDQILVYRNVFDFFVSARCCLIVSTERNNECLSLLEIFKSNVHNNTVILQCNCYFILTDGHLPLVKRGSRDNIVHECKYKIVKWHNIL